MTIHSTFHDYDVIQAANLSDALAGAGEGKRAFYLVDANIIDLYPGDFDDLPGSLRAVSATEEEKSFERVGPVFQWLLDNGFRRGDVLVAVGGGVVQDIACFVASTLMRGVRWNYVPTTLLAQGDSCIGSKSSINFADYKNQLGTFYPPHGVYLSTSLLNTLRPDDRRSGWGEIWKLHFIGGEEKLRWLQSQNADCGVGDAAALWPCIESALLIKQAFIEEDEFDRGVRNILNFGHTFAHAFESATHYAIPHGIGVSLGMDAAIALAVQRNHWTVGTARAAEIRGWLRESHVPYGRELGNASLETIVSAMRRDKKNQSDQITFILPQSPGALEKVAVPADDALRSFLEDWRQSVA